MSTRGQVYFSEGKFYIDQGCAVLKNNFSRADIMEDLRWANAPLVHAGQEVLLVIDKTKSGFACVAIMRVSEHIDIHCSTVCCLEEIAEEVEK